MNNQDKSCDSSARQNKSKIVVPFTAKLCYTFFIKLYRSKEYWEDCEA